MNYLNELYAKVKEQKQKTTKEEFNDISSIFQNAVFNFYRKNNKTEGVKETTLNIIKNSLIEDIGQNFMWRVFFEADRKMNREIDLLENKLKAEKYFNVYIKEKNHYYLESTASLAYSFCEDKEKDKIDIEKLQIWENTFKDYPQFKIELDKEIKYWEDFRKETLLKYNITEIKDDREIASTYSIKINAILPKNYKNIHDRLWESDEIKILINELLDDFNDFYIQSYMDDFIEIDCIKSEAFFERDLNNNNFIFKFSFARELTNEEIKKLTDDMLGQLSDGWGESLSQRKILIEDKEISIDFDTTKEKCFIKEETKKNKLNI